MWLEGRRESLKIFESWETIAAKISGHTNHRKVSQANNIRFDTLIFEASGFNWEQRFLLSVSNFIYNGEFDPGSGWTLAAGLIHASRGAAGV